MQYPDYLVLLNAKVAFQQASVFFLKIKQKTLLTLLPIIVTLHLIGVQVTTAMK